MKTLEPDRGRGAEATRETFKKWYKNRLWSSHVLRSEQEELFLEECCFQAWEAGIALGKKDETFSCDACGQQKPIEEKHHGFPYGVETTWCNTCDVKVEPEEYPRRGEGGSF